MREELEKGKGIKENKHCVVKRQTREYTIEEETMEHAATLCKSFGLHDKILTDEKKIEL